MSGVTLFPGPGGGGGAPLVEAVKEHVTFGGCPHGRARQQIRGSAQ